MKDGEFLFEDSEIYNYRVYAYSWGRYHDPLQTGVVGTGKDKSESLKAYQRALTLYQGKNDTKKVNVIREKLKRCVNFFELGEGMKKLIFAISVFYFLCIGI